MPSIYLADRDPTYRKSLAHLLRQRGIDVEEFDSGPVVYSRIVTEEPDLIVLETDLDEMDGFQVFARLQRKRPEKPYPVFFVTEFDHPRVARVCRERGALGYVSKSKPLEEVADAVLGSLEPPDPLEGRPLAGALAWLQSRGKTGRLEVETSEAHGYIDLHKGRLLEAEFGGRRGEPAVALLIERFPKARYKFREGADPLAAPAEVATRPRAQATADPEGTGAAGQAVSTTAATRGPAAKSSADATSRKPAPHPVSLPDPFRSARPTSEISVRPGRGGAVAAVRELERKGRVGGQSRTGRRVLTATLVLAGVGAVGVALAALDPALLPFGLASGLRGKSANETAPGVEAAAPRPVSPSAPAVSQPADSSVRAVSSPSAPPASHSDTGARFDVTPQGGRAPYGRSFGPSGDQTEPETGPSGPTASERMARTGERATAASAGSAPERPSTGRAAPAARAAPQPVPATRPAPQPAPATRPAAPPAPAPVREEPPTPPAAASVAPPPAAASVTPPPADSPPSAERETEASLGTEDPAAGSAVGRNRTTVGAGEEPLLGKPVLLQRSDDLYYPPELRAQGIGGSVLLNIRVGTNGRAQQVEVARSSGYEAFDQAAVAAVGTFLWEPARSAEGPAEAWITQAVTFHP